MASARKMNRKPVKTGSFIEALQRGEKPLVMWKGKNLVDEIYDLAKYRGSMGYIRKASIALS